MKAGANKFTMKDRFDIEVIVIEFLDGTFEVIEGEWSNYSIDNGMFVVNCRTGEPANYYAISEIRAIRTMDRKDAYELLNLS